ncbi:MAG: pH-response regulator protein palA/rim20 [Peltula sp. TS41687]|nr:MAG: pH-response regulator protein palA/rim20 [Peltula sp. TS41687]
MASNILFLPFRRTHSTSLSEAIRQYISSKYDQHPDMFASDLETIDKLRNEAINVLEPQSSGIRKITAWAAQLVWISGKFPIDIGVDFVWYPALGYNTQKPSLSRPSGENCSREALIHEATAPQNNLRFELANILYNLASLYSQLAFSLNRTNSEGLRSACNYFCQAAGVISYLKDHVIPEMRSLPPEDMDAMTLESLEQLMLAQAQECFWQKAVMDGLKDASIAKLAAMVSDYYSTAGDFAVKSDSISSEWIHHMTAKHHHFAAAAQYRAACDCLEKRRYGEEVARLRDSQSCVNEALKEARWLNKVVLGDLHGLRNRVVEHLKRAEKDNDIIYLNPVPPKSELKLLDRANMATIKVPMEISDPISMLGERGHLGKPLFAKLVPYSVHVAASIYVERRDRLVNHSIIEELEGLNIKLHELLQSLNLPGSLQALERPLGLPPGLVAHAEEIRQQDGLNRLYRSMEDITKLKASDRGTYNEGLSILQQEAAEDDRARAKYGTDRWTRPRSREAAEKLWSQADEVDGYLKSAQSSDQLVEGKLKAQEQMLRLLAGINRDLEDFVPSSRRTNVTPKVEREAAALRTCLNEISRLESSRRKKVEAVKQKAKADDINPIILKEAGRLEREYPMQKIEPAHFENLFEQRLQLYEPDLELVSEEREKQDDLVTKLQEANANFVVAKKGDSSSKEREQALQKLENAYYKYKEIVSNLDVGRKFYNDLAKIVSRFRDECKGFAYQRRNEAEQLQNDITTGLSALSLSSHRDNLQQQLKKQQDQPASAVPSGFKLAPTAEPVAAPSPNHPRPIPPGSMPGMWTPNMPIKFGDPGSGPTAPNTGLGGTGVSSQSTGKSTRTPWDPKRGIQFG